MPTPFTADFPAYFDEYEPEIEAKGYFADVSVQVGGTVLRPTFYDPARFRQECEDAFAGGAPYVSSPLLILVPAVTRAGIMSALESLAAGDFRDLLP